MGLIDGQNFTAVLFDLDGVLADSTASVNNCWAQLLREAGMDASATPIPHGVPSAASIERLIPHKNAEELAHWILRHNELEIEDADGTVEIAGAQQLLNELSQRQIPWAIATGCNQPLFEARFGAVGLPRPEIVVTASQYLHGKPSPDPYLMAAELLKQDPANCIVIEDAPAGITSGKAAGATVIALTTTHTADELSEADYIFDSLAQAHELLLG
jgi:sugar-phosphatase